jgi:glycosyltransferase involved in cell wall biosynthesis
MSSQPLTVAWISQFPVEWMPDIPEHLRHLPRQHPAPWQRVLLEGLQGVPSLSLHVLALRKEFVRSERFERNGVTFHVVKTPAGLRAATLFWSDTWLIRRVLKDVRPDVVHAWGTERGSGLIASRLGYPYLLTMHGLLEWLGEQITLDTYHRFAALLEKRTLRLASIVTVESSFGLQFLKERHPHLELHQVEHAPLPLFQEIKRAPQLAPVRFLFVGAFSLGKGVDVMLKALDRFKEQAAFELVIAGSTDQGLVRKLESEVSKELWRRVRFAGSLSAPEIAREMAVATMMVYPTRCDNSPNAVKEAVVAGLPVVASAIGGILDYVWPDLNGALFEPGSVNACLEAIQSACRHPLFSRGLVEVAALNNARDYLSADRMSRRFVELYRLAANSKTTPRRG